MRPAIQPKCKPNTCIDTTSEDWIPGFEHIVDLMRGDHALLIANAAGTSNSLYATCARMDDGDLKRFVEPDVASWLEPFRQAIPLGKALTWSQLVSDRHFERMPLYNEVVRPANGFYAVVARHELPSMSYFLAICRPRRAGDYSRDDVAKLQSFLPYITSALELQHRLRVSKADYAQLACILDRLDIGVILTDATASILFANRAAEALLGGNGLHLNAGALGTHDSCSTRRLRELIAASARAAVAGDGWGGSVEIPRGDWRTPLNLFVVPFRLAANYSATLSACMPQPVAMILARDPGQERQSRKQRLMRHLFGLTAAEADLAAALLRGETLQTHARFHGRSLNTVKSHLKSVFAKTGTRRQAELVRELAAVCLLLR